MKNVFIIAAMALCLLLCTSVPAQTNGSFESSGCGGFSFIEPFAGSSAITGWTIGGQGVDLVCTHWQASDGTNSVDLNRVAPGSISQDISTVAGYTYQVTFDMSGNPEAGLITNPNHPWFSPMVKTFEVNVDGSDPAIYSFDTAAAGNTRSNMMWTSASFFFTTADETSTLTFASTTPGAFGPTVDNINISVVTQVCHRNNGGRGSKTLTVGEFAVAAHLGHGDQPGPCETTP